MVCEVKSVSRGVQILNVFLDILTKIEQDFVVNFEMTQKTSTNDYKNVFVNLSVNLCKDVLGSPLIQFTAPLFDKYAPGLVHNCPYGPEKKVGIQNFTMDLSMIPLLTFTPNDRSSYRILDSFLVRKKLVAVLKIFTKIVPKRYSKRKPSSTNNLKPIP
jgi:hypothetical protein